MNAGATTHTRLVRGLFDAPGGSEWRDLVNGSTELEIFAAGGCVRDLLFPRPDKPKDFDIFLAGSGVPRALEKLARAGRLEYGPFGSPRWFPDPRSSFYCDVIPIARFFNGLWPCENITDALNQFDFTANAVAFNLRTGEFFNPQNGVRDLERRIMRAVRFDYPAEPIAPGLTLSRPEVVWFRILHYAALLELAPDPVTLRWLRGNRPYASNAACFESLFFPLHPRWLSPLELEGP